MGCYNHKHTDGKVYFIPDCWGSVIHGKHACACRVHSGERYTDQELIEKLKQEIRELKLKLKQP